MGVPALPDGPPADILKLSALWPRHRVTNSLRGYEIALRGDGPHEVLRIRGSDVVKGVTGPQPPPTGSIMQGHAADAGFPVALVLREGDSR